MTTLKGADTATLRAASPAGLGRLLSSTVSAGVANGQSGTLSTVHLTMDLGDARPDELALVVFDAAGGHAIYPLAAQAGHSTSSIEIQHPVVVESMQVLSVVGKQIGRIEEEPTGNVLGRVLARNLADINHHIRWSERIEDYDSRVFTACNSYQHLKSDAGLAAYCLVSIGYTALERRNDPLAGFVYDELRSIFWKRLGKLHGEARFSFITHLMHHCLYFCNPGLFEKLIVAGESSLKEVESEPIAAFNAIVIVLLGGSYYLTLGKHKRAAELLDRGDAIFRIAAAGYPRTPGMFRELTTICERARRAHLGAATARGYPPKPELGLGSFDGPSVAADCNRLRDAAAKARMADLLRAMVRTRQERQQAAEGP